MAEVREIREAMQKRKKRRTVRRIAVLTILLSLVVVIFINRDFLTPDAISHWLSLSLSGESGGFPVSLPSGEPVMLSEASGNIVYTNQTGIYFYSPRGKQLRSISHSEKNVQAKASGDNVIFYSAGGNKVNVETSVKTACKVETDNSIITGEVAKNGRFVIATESDVYTSEMNVYDKNANAIFKWIPSGGAISAVGISSDGSYVAASTVNAKGGKLVSGVYLFSTSKSDALVSYQLENELVLSVYCDRDSVTAVTDSNIIQISKQGRITGKISFDGKKLICISPSDAGSCVALRDINDPEKSVFAVVGKDCEIKAEAAVGRKITDMACSGKKAYLVSGSHIFEYETSTAVKTGETTLNGEAGHICANSSGAYAVTSSLQLIKCEIK